MGRFATSWELVKESFAVLQKDKEIMLFPLLSAVVTVLLFMSFLLPLFFGSFAGDTFFYGILFVYYLFSYFIVIFFNTGLIACARIRLDGGDPTFKDGWCAAVKHIGPIFGWALVSATVGLLLRMLADKARDNFITQIIISLLGIAWTFLTFFVIPVLIFEHVGVFEAIKRSGSLFKKTWGENVIVQFSLGGVFLVLGLLGALPLVLAFALGASLTVWLILLSVCILYWTLLGIVSASLNGIFIAALYHYALKGEVPRAFTAEHVKQAFTGKSRTITDGFVGN